MFEEQRIKLEGQRGLRAHEYWLESGIVETNHRPKAQNNKVGLTESLWVVPQGQRGLANLFCDLFPSLGTTGCPQNSHHSFFTGSPTDKPPGAQDEPTTEGALTWMAHLDHFHPVFWWRRGTGSRFLNESMGLRMAMTWGLSKSHQTLETQVLYLCLQDVHSSSVFE